jgi:hypothetical protein
VVLQLSSVNVHGDLQGNSDFRRGNRLMMMMNTCIKVGITRLCDLRVKATGTLSRRSSPVLLLRGQIGQTMCDTDAVCLLPDAARRCDTVLSSSLLSFSSERFRSEQQQQW